MAENLNSESLTVRNLSFSFGKKVEVLKNLSFSLDQEEVLALVGPSGCGKTTIVRLLGGLLFPASGEVRINGVNAREDQLKGKVALFSQAPTLLPWRTVDGNIRLPIEFERVVSSGASIGEAIQTVGLVGFEHSYPNQLSGGMKQRAVFARLVVAEHKLVLLDEPFCSLDDFSRQEMGQLFIEIQRSRKFAAVIVTHSIEEAVFLADKVIVLSARPGQVISEHRISFESPRTRELLKKQEFFNEVQKIRSLLP